MIPLVGLSFLKFVLLLLHAVVTQTANLVLLGDYSIGDFQKKSDRFADDPARSDLHHSP